MTEFWKYKAVCHKLIEKLPRLATAWITESGPDLKEATAVCMECPVRMECLASALRDKKSYGMRGGYFFKNGTLTQADANRLASELGITARTRRNQNKDKLEKVPQLA